jgi:predicted dehydrogenase
MAETLETLRTGIALIGAGMIAPTHVAALSDLRDKVRLHAIVSRRPERAAYLADHYAGKTPKFTADLSDITQNPDIQVVIVATPPDVRIELIQALAEAEKHILLEKPVARNLGEARQVVEICEKAGVTLGMLFQHRAHASSKAAARLIAGGVLGKLGLVEIAAPLWRDQSYYDELGRGTYARDGGGVLLTQAIHTIDLALSLTGPVTRVQAMAATTPLHRMESEDYAVAGLTFASGAVGSLVASTATFPPGQETITLHHQNGSLRHGRHALDVSWRDGRTDRETFGHPAPGEGGPVVAQHELHRDIIEDFVDALRDGRAPIVTGREGLVAHRLIDAIERSSRTGAAADIADG